MAEPIAEEGSGPFGRAEQLYYHIGKALVAWQDVEDAHFGLFYTLLGALNYKAAAVAYYSVENFALRNAMIGRLVLVSLAARDRKKQRRVWHDEQGGLCAEIVAASKIRNKLAHYGIEISAEGARTTDGITDLLIGEPKMRASAYNVVSEMSGEDAALLSLDAVRACTKNFKDLAEKIDLLRESIPSPPDTSPGQSSGLPPRFLVQRGIAGRQMRSAVEPSDK